MLFDQPMSLLAESTEHSRAKDANVKVKMFNTFVRPKMEYASVVWDPHLKKDITALENVQRRYTKRIYGLWDVPYEDRLDRLGLSTLRNRRIFLDLLLLYKIVFNLCSIPFDSLFTFAPSVRQTRGHNMKLFHRHARTDVFKFFYSNRIVSHWNNLGADIVNVGSYARFKEKLRHMKFNIV